MASTTQECLPSLVIREMPSDTTDTISHPPDQLKQTRGTTPNIPKAMEHWNAHTLLVGVRDGTTASESCLEVSCRITQTLQPSNPTTRH